MHFLTMDGTQLWLTQGSGTVIFTLFLTPLFQHFRKPAYERRLFSLAFCVKFEKQLEKYGFSNKSISVGTSKFPPHFLILSKIGRTCSNDGRFPGSSFMQIRMNFAMWLDIPGEISIRNPSVAI